MLNFNSPFMFKFLQKSAKGDSKKAMPQEFQVKIVTHGFNTKELKNILNEYDLKAHELDLIATDFRHKEEFDLAEKCYMDSLKKNDAAGDVYGNLISLYALQEKYDLCEKTFVLGMNQAAGRGRNFMCFHMGRTLAKQGDYKHATDIAILGIQESGEEHYEPLYVLCIDSWTRMFQNGKQQGLPDGEIKEAFEMASKTARAARVLFPKSEKIKELYDIFFEE